MYLNQLSKVDSSKIHHDAYQDALFMGTGSELLQTIVYPIWLAAREPNWPLEAACSTKKETK
jgi:hypothetical protein